MDGLRFAGERYIYILYIVYIPLLVDVLLSPVFFLSHSFSGHNHIGKVGADGWVRQFILNLLKDDKIMQRKVFNSKKGYINVLVGEIMVELTVFVFDRNRVYMLNIAFIFLKWFNRYLLVK